MMYAVVRVSDLRQLLYATQTPIEGVRRSGKLYISGHSGSIPVFFVVDLPDECSDKSVNFIYMDVEERVICSSDPPKVSEIFNSSSLITVVDGSIELRHVSGDKDKPRITSVSID